jgi:hypothetical protein
MAEISKSRRSQSGYFTIATASENKLGSTDKIWREKYTLLSAAKFDNYGIDIYNTFFRSAYSQQYYK